MTNFNWIDYLVLSAFLASMVAGLMRGLIKEVIGLLTWLIALVASSLFATRLANHFVGTPEVQSMFATNCPNVGAKSVSVLAIGVSFVCIFVLVLIAGKIVNYLISSMVETRGISFANRFLGSLFGLARGVLFVLIAMFLVELTPLGAQPFWGQSQFVHSFQPIVKWIGDKVQPGIENLKTRVSNTINNVGSQYIQGANVFRAFGQE